MANSDGAVALVATSRNSDLGVTTLISEPPREMSHPRYEVLGFWDKHTMVTVLSLQVLVVAGKKTVK